MVLAAAHVYWITLPLGSCTCTSGSLTQSRLAKPPHSLFWPVFHLKTIGGSPAGGQGLSSSLMLA